MMGGILALVKLRHLQNYDLPGQQSPEACWDLFKVQNSLCISFITLHIIDCFTGTGWNFWIHYFDTAIFCSESNGARSAK